MSKRAQQYRYRGNVAPSAEVARPVMCRRNAAGAPSGTSPVADAATSATLDIFDVIDSWGGWFGISARDVDAALARAGDVDTLYVRINSPGGEGSEGVAIANLLRAHPATVRVTVYGMAFSAASYIAIAGDVVSMAPGSMMMVHDAWNLALGSAADLRAEADALDALSDSIASLYVLKAGGTDAEWRAVMRAEKWYTAQQTVDAKLADRVGLDTGPAPINADDLDDELADLIDSLAEDSAARPALAARAARRFDLSMFTHTPVALQRDEPKTPAEPPVTPPTETEEADTMSDTLIKGLRERLGVTDETIDETGLLSALDEALAEGANAEAQANSQQDNAELTVLRRELDATQAQLRTLSEARQRDEETARDETKARVFGAAFARGAVHPADHPERVQDEADYDAAPEVMTRVLAGRADGSRIPVKAAGYGSDTDAKAQADDGWFPQFSSKPRVEA